MQMKKQVRHEGDSKCILIKIIPIPNVNQIIATINVT